MVFVEAWCWFGLFFGLLVCSFALVLCFFCTKEAVFLVCVKYNELVVLKNV